MYTVAYGLILFGLLVVLLQALKWTLGSIKRQLDSFKEQ